jgi:hypothetical protein
MTHIRNKFVISLFSMAIIFGGTLPQSLATESTSDMWARVLPAKPERTVLEPYHRDDVIFVKFLDDSSVRVADGRITAEDTAEQAWAT